MRPIRNHDELRIAGKPGRFPRVELIEPNPFGYILLALEVDHRPPPAYIFESARKKRLLEALKGLLPAVRALDGVREAILFKTLILPPSGSEYKKARPDVPQARFDIVVLIETATPERARELRNAPQISALEEQAQANAHRTLTVTGSNVRRIGPVDHSRDGVFLFNYFLAESREQNLAVWEYTAGWFTDQTGLDNSTVILPDAGQPGGLTLINHCRWDRLRDILPSLVFKPSFRNYVLANFDANNTAPMPVLYRLA